MKVGSTPHPQEILSSKSLACLMLSISFFSHRYGNQCIWEQNSYNKQLQEANAVLSLEK